MQFTPQLPPSPSSGLQAPFWPDETACLADRESRPAHTPARLIHPAPLSGAEVLTKVDDAAPPTPTSPLSKGDAERAGASARSALQVAGLFAIPDSDTVEFCRLPEAVRWDVRHALTAFEAIHAAANKVTACKVQAATFRDRRGFSAASLYRKYYAYVADWNWRTIINKAKAGPDYYRPRNGHRRPCRLPEEFLDYWGQLCGENQRKCRPAWRKLIRQWEAWRAGDRQSAIPGYERCPEPEPATGRPRGWEYSNLMRHKPTRFELVAQRQGRSAAADYRPLVFTTRVGLRVGQYILFDDFWHDFKVNVLGQRQAQRLLQFHALDLFSGCNFARGYKPVLEDEMTGAMERLKESEMVFLVAHVLSACGYRRDGTVLVVEHGTAAIRPDLEALISDLTGGVVRVERSGMEGAAAFAGAYAGRSKGNFRFKAALESLGNLIHNETADTRLIPGQVGSNARLNAPEELHGRERYNDALLRAMAALPPERAALLRLPFLEFTQAVWIVNAIHDLINSRTDHHLEGWRESGLIVSEWRMSHEQPWLPAAKLLTLSADQRSAIEAYITQQSGLTRVRQMSPREVWEAGRTELVRLPAHKTAMLLYASGRNHLRERTVRGRLIEFYDDELSPGPLRYVADAHLPNQAVQRLTEDGTYAGIVNPLDLSELHLFDAKGRYVGACPRWNSISRADTDALHRQMGRAAKMERELLEPVARRGAAITRQRIADARHNAAVLGGRPVTPAEQARARALRQVDASAEALLDPPSDPSAPSDWSDPTRFSAEALL